MICIKMLTIWWKWLCTPITKKVFNIFEQHCGHNPPYVSESVPTGTPKITVTLWTWTLTPTLWTPGRVSNWSLLHQLAWWVSFFLVCPDAKFFLVHWSFKCPNLHRWSVLATIVAHSNQTHYFINKLHLCFPCCDISETSPFRCERTTVTAKWCISKYHSLPFTCHELVSFSVQ